MDLARQTLTAFAQAQQKLSTAQRRKKRLEIVDRAGGTWALRNEIRKVIAAARASGLYSPKTVDGDIRASLIRTWQSRGRDYVPLTCADQA